MSVKTSIHERDGIYFITFTCQAWSPLFELTDSYDAVYQWFDYLKAKGWTVLHIMAAGKVKEHKYTAPARIVDGNVFYSDEN